MSNFSKQNEGEETTVLACAGALSLPVAGRFQQLLSECFRESVKTVVDLRETVEIDLSALQLLHAAHLACAGRHRRLKIRDSARGIFAAAAARAGFQACRNGEECGRGSCIWPQGD